MKYPMSTWKLLLYRETRMVLRSPHVLSLMLLPLFYAVIFTLVGHQPFTVAQACINMSVSVCGVFIPASLLVMEKETNEWRALGRSGIPSWMLLGCKMFIAASLTSVILFLCSWIIGYESLHMLRLFPVLLPVLISFILTGVLVGVAHHSVEEIFFTKWFTILLFILLIVLPVIIPFQDHPKLLVWYGRYPTGIVSEAMRIINSEESTRMLLIAACKACLWVIILSIACYGFIRKKGGIY